MANYVTTGRVMRVCEFHGANTEAIRRISLTSLRISLRLRVNLFVFLFFLYKLRTSVTYDRSECS